MGCVLGGALDLVVFVVSGVFGVCGVFLKLFVRGGVRVRSALLVVVVFSGCVFGLFSLFSSYSGELGLVLEGWVSGGGLCVSDRFFEGCVNVTVYCVDFGGVEGFLVLVDDVEGYVGLHGCRVEGRLPGVDDEVVAGFRLGFQVGDNLTVGGLVLRVVGVVFCDDYVSYSVVGFSSLDVGLEGGFSFYEGRVSVNGDRGGVFAPSLVSLFRGVLLEVWRSFSIVLAVLVVCLVVGVFYAGYALVLESREVFGRLRFLSPSLGRFVVSLFFASFVVCLCGVFMGFAVGFLGSSLFSAFVSLFLGFPYVRPVFSWDLFLFGLVILLVSWVSFGFSLVYGFVRSVEKYV